jgi:hypothetical protein
MIAFVLYVCVYLRAIVKLCNKKKFIYLISFAYDSDSLLEGAYILKERLTVGTVEVKVVQP